MPGVPKGLFSIAVSPSADAPGADSRVFLVVARHAAHHRDVSTRSEISCLSNHSFGGERSLCANRGAFGESGSDRSSMESLLCDREIQSFHVQRDVNETASK